MQLERQLRPEAYTRLPSGWGTRGCSNEAGATIRTVPASGFAGGSWRQQQAQVTVGDPARLQDLTERVRAQLVHGPPPGFLAMAAREEQATRPTRTPAVAAEGTGRAGTLARGSGGRAQPHPGRRGVPLDVDL
jgi:hypothetical protein